MGIDFGKIEKKWQGRWERGKVFEAKEVLSPESRVVKKGRKPYYVLEMFAYPSGEGLHMGHAFNFVIGDVFARFKIMNGFNVLHPVGYDALGLPAENAAIKAGTHPGDYTKNSIPNFMRQQKGLGLSYDWSRMINTADASYYKWDQWIFLKMLEKGLAYQKTSAVNWCSKCNTVLANEQVSDGKCWIHDDCEVEVRKLKQWFLKITDYADELYSNLEKMDWPDRTKAMQRNWIGKSQGTEIDFSVETPAHEGCSLEPETSIWKIFTTRPDTLFGVTFMVVSAQHPKLMELVNYEHEKDVEKFLKKLKSVNEKDAERLEKEGVFSGSYAVNPANGDRVPVWIGNFVLADYGAGMVMGVPAHDARDFEFAKKYGIEVRQVVCDGVSGYGGVGVSDDLAEAFVGEGKLINSGEFDGVENVDAKKKISDWLIKKKVGRRVVNFKLRDWGISRQRYWGTPIPIVHCGECGVVPVAEKDLPVVLPKDVKFGKGNPLESNEKWLSVKCPKCGGKGRRESDTMDTFVNSSWYFMRYCDARNDKKIFDVDKVGYWCPIDAYIGGAEHACMHLIYSRFYVKFLRDLGLIDFDEPAVRLFHQGMINDEKGEKMSKSKGNIVEPLETMGKYGVDATRFFLLSVASPNKGFDWSEKGITGSARFIKKIMDFFDKHSAGRRSQVVGRDSKEVLSKLNLAVKNIGERIEAFDYRPATIELRELFDLLGKQEGVSRKSLESALKLLTPFCPHVAEELWEKLRTGCESLVVSRERKDRFISVASWPKVDESKIKLDIRDRGLGVRELNGKIVEDVLRIVEKFPDKEKVYLYVMPFEIGRIDVGKISKGVGKDVKVFSVGDVSKYDPEGKAKKARPGKVAIYIE